MSADNLQKYILELNSKVRAMKRPNNGNEEFNLALVKVSEMLTEERREVIDSYKALKDRGAL